MFSSRCVEERSEPCSTWNNNQSMCLNSPCGMMCVADGSTVCSWCAISDQGCGVFGCPAHTKRICNTCTGCQCVVDAACAPPPPVTHLECSGNTCVSVAGAGANECSVNADCVPKYTVSGRVYLDNFNNR